MKGWTLDDIPWHVLDPSKVDPNLLKTVKAAALLEHNGGDYETYLHNVFHDDPAFKAAATTWAREEIQHGLALGRWAEMIDPDFDFEASFRRFTEGYRLPLEARASVRGSRGGELVARCVVEAGTSSFYSSLADVADEPVLKEIASLIAADEFRHYKLFYDTLRRYLEREPMRVWRRAWIAIGRMLEKDDDELAFAYYCANQDGRPYQRRRNSQAYEYRTSWVYGFGHTQRGVAMALKAAGLRPNGRLGRLLGRLAWRYVGSRRRRSEQITAR